MSGLALLLAAVCLNSTCANNASEYFGVDQISAAAVPDAQNDSAVAGKINK